jgi:hypothetical protein
VADIKEANERLARALGGEKHFKHAVTERFRQFLLREGGFDLYNMPVCPHCERLAWWDKGGGGYCPRCGRFEPPVVTFGEFYESDYHTDRITHPRAPVVVDREAAEPERVATVYGGEANLEDKDRVIKAIIPEKKE